MDDTSKICDDDINAEEIMQKIRERILCKKFSVEVSCHPDVSVPPNCCGGPGAGLSEPLLHDLSTVNSSWIFVILITASAPTTNIPGKYSLKDGNSFMVKYSDMWILSFPVRPGSMQARSGFLSRCSNVLQNLKKNLKTQYPVWNQKQIKRSKTH